MQRLIPLDGARALEVEGARTGRVASYRKRADGTIHVESKTHAKALLREGLAVPATTAGPSAHLRGYLCSCGRRNYFKTCGACGSADGTRETR
jgi:hypothetical protein